MLAGIALIAISITYHTARPTLKNMALPPYRPAGYGRREIEYHCRLEPTSCASYEVTKAQKWLGMIEWDQIVATPIPYQVFTPWLGNSPCHLRLPKETGE